MRLRTANRRRDRQQRRLRAFSLHLDMTMAMIIYAELTDRVDPVIQRLVDEVAAMGSLFGEMRRTA